MTMMPRGRGQNDAAVKSHRRCSERHKEDAKAACPRLLCANTKYTIASLVSNDEKAKVVVLLLRASCDDVMLSRTHNKRESVHKKNKEKERERERRKTLSHTHKSKKVCLFDCFVSTRKMHRSIARVVQNDSLCNMTLLFFVRFFLSLSLSLSTKPKKKKTQFLKP